jgi:hypothetical protein
MTNPFQRKIPKSLLRRLLFSFPAAEKKIINKHKFGENFSNIITNIGPNPLKTNSMLDKIVLSN